MASELVNWKSKEFYINLKPSDIPPKNHPERKEFTKWEKGKCLGGITVNGIFIPPTLYWSFNHWALEKDEIDEYGITIKKLGNPDLRDNDWIIHNGLWQAEQQKLDLLEAGCRQVGKSSSTASVLGRDLCLIEGCQDILVVGSTSDRTIILSYLDVGMKYCTDFMRVPQIDRDKKGILYRYGVTLPNGEQIVKSQLHVRNTEEGQNTEVSAGVSIYRAVLDEAGKYPFARSYETLKPALMSQFGRRSSSLITATGGDIKKTKDLESNFKNPVSGGFLAYDNENTKTGLFIDGTHRQDFKEWKTLTEFTGAEPGSELDTIKIAVTNKELANRTLDAEYQTAQKDPEKTKGITHKIYYARKINDMFLSVDTSPFARFFDQLQKHRDYIKEHKPGFAVTLTDIEAGKVDYKLTEERVIENYPPKQFENLDAPFQIWDLPKHVDSDYLHVGGCDPYNTGKTESSPSLGSVYIFRRKYDDLTDPYQDTMVAAYTARPEKTNDFHKNVEKLLKFYGAKLLHEASTDQFLNYFDTKNTADQFLVKAWSLQQEINPDSKARNTYGLMPSVRNQQFIIGAIIEYLEEVIGYDNNGNPILGLTRILDPLLIDELLAYGPENNTDRVYGFGHGLAYMKYLNKYFQPEVEIDTVQYTPTSIKKVPYGFARQQTTVTKKRNPFFK